MSYTPDAIDLTEILNKHFPNSEWNAVGIKIVYWAESNSKKQPTEEWIDTKLKEYGESGRAMYLLRRRRLVELGHSDWTSLDDVGLSEAKNEERKIYRQKLRDLPANSKPLLDEKGRLTNINWPTKPE